MINASQVHKLTIGLTGGIGSGKSVVATLFKQHGVTVIDADDIAKKVVEPGRPALLDIKAHFGEDYLLDGKLNRTRLREHIFNLPEEKKWLENLLHPLIRQEMLDEINAATTPYCIVVIPLLIENHPHPLIKRILVVDTDESRQIQRTLSRDKTSEESVKKILEAQASREERLRLADDVIVNTSDLQSLEAQVAALHKKYLALSI